jgi:hypothetical protein
MELLQSKLKKDIDTSIQFFTTEFKKFMEIIAKDVEDIIKAADSKIQEGYKAEQYAEKLKVEVKALEDKKQTILELENIVNEKAKQIDEDAKANMELHKILENRIKILTAREEELKLKARRGGSYGGSTT